MKRGVRNEVESNDAEPLGELIFIKAIPLLWSMATTLAGNDLVCPPFSDRSTVMSSASRTISASVMIVPVGSMGKPVPTIFP